MMIRLLASMRGGQSPIQFFIPKDSRIWGVSRHQIIAKNAVILLRRTMFDCGVMRVMFAHTALSASEKQLADVQGIDVFRPASVSELRNQKLLRDHLGVNDFIVSEVTPMVAIFFIQHQ